MKLNNKIMLITYADSLGNDLNELKSVIDKYYAKAVGGIHILPFFPSSADRGFAPMRYDQVDARFGSFEQSQPIFITYDLFNALKLADNGFNVALCILGGVLSGEAKNEIAEHECNLIKSVCSQLSKR